MATVIETRRLCDRHLIDKDTREPGEAWTVTVSGPGFKTHTVEVDTCADCNGPLVEVVEYLDAYGHKPRKSRKPRQSEPEPVPEATEPGAAEAGASVCPECGQEFKPAGLAVHRSRTHGVISTSRNAERHRRLKAQVSQE